MLRPVLLSFRIRLQKKGEGAHPSRSSAAQQQRPDHTFRILFAWIGKSNGLEWPGPAVFFHGHTWQLRSRRDRHTHRAGRNLWLQPAIQRQRDRAHAPHPDSQSD
jgi:hypothetical protein